MNARELRAANAFDERKITRMPYQRQQTRNTRLGRIVSLAVDVEFVEPLVKARSEANAHCDHALAPVRMRSSEPARPALPPRPASLFAWAPAGA
eukprot:7055554-Pyramimonas_sp.AAC.1